MVRSPAPPAAPAAGCQTNGPSSPCRGVFSWCAPPPHCSLANSPTLPGWCRHEADVCVEEEVRLERHQAGDLGYPAEGRTFQPLPRPLSLVLPSRLPPGGARASSAAATAAAPAQEPTAPAAAAAATAAATVPVGLPHRPHARPQSRRLLRSWRLLCSWRCCRPAAAAAAVV